MSGDVVEVVRRQRGMPIDTPKDEAIASVESELRDRYDIDHIGAAEVAETMAGNWKITVTGVIVDERGGDE